MPAIPAATINVILAELLVEVCAGPDKPYTWIVTQHKDAGLLGTLAQITAADASRRLVPTGRTIAAHTEHLRFSLAYANAHFRGESPSPDFSTSWSVASVNDKQWQQLQQSLLSEFEEAKQHIESQQDWPDQMMLTGAIAMIAHAAYHLGAIRQMALLLRETRDLPTQAD